MVPGGRPLISIGCKYNVREVLSFIVTYNAGIKQAGLTYLYKYPDHFLIFSLTLLLLPLSCTSSLDMLIWLTSTKNQGSLVWHWKISGLLSVVS